MEDMVLDTAFYFNPKTASSMMRVAAKVPFMDTNRAKLAGIRVYNSSLSAGCFSLAFAA